MTDVFHYFNNDKPNPGVFGPGGKGWRDPYWMRVQVDTAVRLGVGFGARQPLPTRSRTPLHIGGWLEHANEPDIYHDGFIDLFDDAERLTGSVFLYGGHGAGDRQDWSERRDVTDRPYKPDPYLDYALKHYDANRVLDLFDRVLSPYLRAGNKRSHFYADGSGALEKDHPWTLYLHAVRSLMQREGRYCGIESPPDLNGNWDHLRPFNVAAVWHMFRLHVERGWWEQHPGRGLVFLDSDGVSSGDVGGWDEASHRRMAQRFNAVREAGGMVAMSFLAVVRAGFESIDAWLERFAA